MDLYLLLRFFHFIGFIFLGGGLLAVFVSEWRGYSATRPVVFAEAAFYTAILYDFLVVPGALMMLTTGPLLIQLFWHPLADWYVGLVSVRIHRRQYPHSRAIPADAQSVAVVG